LQVFIMHVGSSNAIDLSFTVDKRRSIDELVSELPTNAPELSFFESTALRTTFPDGSFNCWGVPPKAQPSFEKTNVGDIVLFIPNIIGENGGVHFIGVIKATCSIRAYSASRILWPDTPNDRLFPWLFFFDTEIGFLKWDQFLKDIGYASNWNPQGWYRKIADSKFDEWGGANSYYNRLQTHYGFKPITPPQNQEADAQINSDWIVLEDEEVRAEDFQEGSTKKISVNSYERNRQARDACINHYGPICQACEFDFESMYGQLGKGYIHVHHIKPLSEIGQNYTVDPIKDLVPVCPNCHAMIHKTKKPLTIDELRVVIESSNLE